MNKQNEKNKRIKKNRARTHNTDRQTNTHTDTDTRQCHTVPWGTHKSVRVCVLLGTLLAIRF